MMIEKSLHEPALTFGDLIKRSGFRLMMMAVGVFTAVLLLMVVGWWVSTAVAAPTTPQTTFTVTTNTDTNDGNCNAHCTLREAIHAANTLSATDVIVFNLPPLSQTIVLNNELPSITDSLTIDGSHVPSLTISGNNLYQIFFISPGISTTVRSMSIISSNQSGILNFRGNLTLNNVSFRGNKTIAIYGGGVINYYGSLSVHNCAFINNSANAGGAIYSENGSLIVSNSNFTGNASFRGGGIYNQSGSLLVQNSTFINNSAETGGGIDNDSGNLVVNDTYFNGNEATNLGGGIISSGFLYPVVTIISNTIFIDNTAAEAGGILSSGLLTLTNSTFSHNSANRYGGGLLNAADAVISQTSFLSNTAGHSGGAIHNDNSLFLHNSAFDGNTANQYGGAIVNYGTQFYSATVTVTHSLFQRNSAGYGGGIANWTGYKVDVRNSTFSGNTAITAGGGISNSHVLQLNNVTVSDNEAAVGGGIASSGAMTISNSIVANSVGSDCANSGLFHLNVNNLVEDGSCNPLLSGDPLLRPLADNGGETWTHALLPGSPAIDAGDNALCELTDQRGVIRPIDGDGNGTAVCDIGAVEQEPAEPQKIFLPLLLKP